MTLNDDPLPQESMPSIAQPRSAASITPRSILARFVQPFQPKPRNLTDFHIQTEEPYRQYGPGDLVKGSVLVTVHTPIRITHIVLSLHGFVKVYRGANPCGDRPPRDAGALSPGRGTRGPAFVRNGLATIFEDEAILCAEGRLVPNTYAFAFALQFPSQRMPTSIDFERGTIAYMLTATLTRPTTISPTMSCERDVPFFESLDIAAFSKPKPRVIVLEPVIRRVKSKQPRRQLIINARTPQAEEADSQTSTPRTDSTIALTNGTQNSASPVNNLSRLTCSIGDAASVQSSATASDRVMTMSTRMEDHMSTNAKDEGTIVATIEVLRGACLPGDIVPISINVDHTREIRALEGIVVTLYRSARVDRQPLVSIGVGKGKTSDDEDHPRSRTGLGGLSLSSAESTHTFRLDLAQTFAPLIVDPKTLAAVIKTSIQVPDDVFPTISCTPGAMITFKYFIEVVVDIRGKFAGLDRILPRLSRTGAPMARPSDQLCHTFAPTSLQRSDQRDQVLLDVGQIRRDRGVISCLFELVIGTKDSQRKASSTWAQLADDSNHETSDMLAQDAAEYLEFEHDPSTPDYEQDGSLVAGHDDRSTIGLSEMNDVDYQDSSFRRPYQGPILDRPPLSEPTDEKSRIRQAEQRLLPSAPFSDNDDPQPEMTIHATAPPLSEIEDYTHAESSAPTYGGESTRHPREHASGSGTFASMGDDKQELERQRLLATATSPDDNDFDDNDDNDNEGGMTRSGVTMPLPTAPILSEDDGHQAYPPKYVT